jgi:RNA polymerase sigma-70 factor (ECF subfamily)
MLANALAVTEIADPVADLIREGDYRAAMAQCAELHGPALGRLCMAFLGSQADAEEAVQETLLAAHASMASYRGEGTVRAWLFGIARRQCARVLERGPHRRQHLQLIDACSGGQSPREEAAAHRRAATIRAALALLNPSERDAVILHYQAGLSFREIATITGTAEATARKRASRGLGRLRKHLNREDME